MKDTQFAKLVVFVSSLVPAGMMALDWWTGAAGAHVGFYLMRSTGLCALIFLLLSLCVTPLRRLTGKNYWSLFRRMLGLYAFFYAGLHLLCYVIKYKGGDFAAILEDIGKSRFIFLGMGAFLIMVPLAATSTAGAIKRMGARNWKRLHRLVYIAATAGALHFYLQPKADRRTPLLFALALVVLLGVRVVAAMRERVVAAEKGKQKAAVG